MANPRHRKYVFRLKKKFHDGSMMRNRSVKFEVTSLEKTRFSRPLKILILAFLGGSPRFSVKIEKFQFDPETPSERSK